ncbi:MAG: hypothetical protein HC819_20110 [Cyclobacteriaceae bacterium]|nr:hypothetical protein [Cyclobacteriaceae bacterium]
MKFRPLEKARTIIKDATGLDIMYAYDDLVFPDYGAFILQFDDSNEQRFNCYFNVECEEFELSRIFHRLEQICKLNKLSLKSKGKFNFEQKEEQVEIHFLP